MIRSRIRAFSLSPLSPRVAYLLLALMMVGYVLFQSSVAIRLHEAFVTSADDLSNIDQVVWNSQHGRILERTEGPRSVPRYGEHLEPIWIALGLLYLFWDSVKALLVTQTVALAAGALPVFWLARDSWSQATGATRPDYGAGLAFAALYLLSPFVGRANSAEVHALPFAVAPLLLAIAWGWQGRWHRVAPLMLLLLLVREDAGLLVGAFGAWALVARRAWRPALALIAGGALGVGIAVFGIIATFAEQRFGGGQEQSIFFERYAAFGEGPMGILRGMLTRPDLWADLLGDPWRTAFLRDFVLSTGGLMLLSPLSWLLFAPHFVLNLLSDYFGQYGGLQHYAAPLVPGLMVAAILGGATALRWGRGHPILRVLLLLAALGGTLGAARSAIWQPLAASWIQPSITAHHRLLLDIARQIPAHAPLSADPQLHPHLAHRPDAYRFPSVGENTEWILVDVTTNTTQHPADLRRDLLALLEGEWGIAEASDGYLLLRRGAPEKQLPERFLSFARSSAPPSVPLHAHFGDLIEVLGYDLAQDFWGRVSVRWQLRPLVPLPSTLSLDAALLNEEGMPLPETLAQPLTLLVWLPPEQWQPGTVYVVQTLPRQATTPFWPALTARLEGFPLVATEISMEEPTPALLSQLGPWVTAGAWRLENNHIQRAAVGWRQWNSPVPPAKEPGVWAAARLGAWQIQREGERLHVTLHWLAIQSENPALQRFVHLVPAEGAPVPIAQADGPLGGAYPITRWVQGEWVSEQVTLTIPPDAPGKLQLLVGLYEPQSGQRLPVVPGDGHDAFKLGQLSDVESHDQPARLDGD